MTTGTSNKVGVIGAGPGGLAAAVLLQSKGFQVEIFESLDRVGGRNGVLEVGDFRFDTGPTFFLMPDVLEEIFHACGRSMRDYLELKRIDPLYKLDFGDGTTLLPSSDPYKMSREIGKLSARDANAFWLFRERQREKFNAVLPVLRQSFLDWSDYVRFGNLAAIPFLDFSSVYDELTRYFEDERVRLSFTFQAKYLGMSPFDCPSLFTILPHIEHSMGVWHPVGGCNQISQALAKLFKELGGTLHLSTRVTRCEVEQGELRALEVEGQGRRVFDYAVLNADFAYSMKDLVPEAARQKYKDSKLDALKYSCSTFMLYLGLDSTVDFPHHGIYFARNYRKNLRELCDTMTLSEDPSFYVHNPGVTDQTMAPAGQTGIYVLVPVPNLTNPIDWKTEAPRYRDLVLDKIAERTGVDLRPLIVAERVITPLDWQDEFRVFKGAVFNLAHTLDQMLSYRPRNEFEEFRNFYLVGGGTHPGSGLPTIFESGRIAAALIERRHQKTQGRSLAARAANLRLGLDRLRRRAPAAPAPTMAGVQAPQMAGVQAPQMAVDL